MIIAGQLLLPSADPPGRCQLKTGYVRVEGEQFTEVVEGELPHAPDLGGPGFLITPGLIDTHLHFPQFDIVGAHGLPLLDWLERVTFPAERRWEDTAYAREMTRRAVHQLFAHGTTTICAYATVHHAATAAALEVASALGMRGVIGQTLIDRHAPAYLCRNANQLIAESADLLARFPPGQRLSAAVTPRFAVSCSTELLEQAGRLALAHDAVVQSHLAETRAECDLVAELFPGRSYAQAYSDAGLLTPRSIYGHGIFLDAASQQMLAEAGAVVAHCPTANSFLRSGVMDRRALCASGVRLSLGSDVGAGYERSMVRVARAMIEAAASLGLEHPTADEAWWQITAGNADALGWADAGRLLPGGPADLLVIEPDVCWLGDAVPALDRLLWAWDDRWLRRTLARGQTVYAAGPGAAS